MAVNPEYDYLFKIVLVGDAGTPKTKLVNCFKNKDPNDSSFHTVGIDFCTTTVEMDNKTIKAQLWDTAGQERYRTGVSGVYRGATGMIIVYDVTKEETFVNADTWLNNVMEYTNGRDIVVMIVGSCLERDMVNRVVSTERGKLYAAQHDLLYKEVPYDDVEGVNETFMTLIKEIYLKKNSNASENRKEKASIFDWRTFFKPQSSTVVKSSDKNRSLVIEQLQREEPRTQSRLQSSSKRPLPLPDYGNVLKEADQLSKMKPNLKVESNEQFVQHRMTNQEISSKKQHILEVNNEELKRRNQQLQTDIRQLQTGNQQLQTSNQQLLVDKQQLQEEVSRLQSEMRRLQDQLVSSQQRHNDSDSSWKVSHNEVKITGHELGRGGWGVIWIGMFREQKVAVKQMHEAITSRVNLDLLHREINTMAQLRHPNLLQFIGAVFDDPSGNPMIITEIMDTSLRKAYEDKLLQTPTNDCPVPVSVRGIMRDVAVGLNYLHCLPDPIIHRDVSSANVLLESKGNGKWKTKISDFGSANKAKQATTRAAGAIVYSAPESLLPVTVTGTRRQLTTKMDVFSYGILMCEVVNCKFPDNDVFPEMLRQVKVHCSWLHTLVCECISEQPTERPSMKQVIKTIDQS